MTLLEFFYYTILNLPAMILNQVISDILFLDIILTMTLTYKV